MKISSFVAVYDACVLYPAPLRDFLMWLGLSGRFRPRWSPHIQDEWQRNVLRDRPDLSAAQLQHTSDLMNAAIPDGMVSGYETLIPNLRLPDQDDRHVLAAAIRCCASVIVTFNLKDFPESALEPFGIEAQHPDIFIENLFDLDAAAVLEAAQKQRANLRSPPMGVAEFLACLSRQGLVKTTRALSDFSSIL